MIKKSDIYKILIYVGITMTNLSALPSDFSVLYCWVAGSMPPPAHSEYTIFIEASGNCSVEYIPDYPSKEVPVWKETFDLSVDRLEALYLFITEKKIFTKKFSEVKPKDRRVGGSYAWIDVEANGKRVRLGTHLIDKDQEIAKTVYDEIRNTVPQAIWDTFSKKREQYKKEVYNE